MYPTNTVSQICSLSIRRTIYKCALMYVYRIIAPKYKSKPPPPFRTSLHIKDCKFRYWGQQNTLTTSSMPTKTFNMLCKPTNLQYVPWTTNKALRTSIRRFDHLHRHSIKQHAYDREHCHSYLQFVHRTTNTTTETFSTLLGPSALTHRPPVYPQDDLHHHLNI